jgi:hypothetical protein
MAAALDLQLRQRAEERRIYRSDFFVRELLAESSFGALPRFLNFRLVDLIRLNGQIRQDGHPVTQDFDHSLTYGKKRVLALLSDNDLTRHHLRHQRNVLREHSHLAFDPWQGDHFHVLGVGRSVWSYDLEF